jgi:hypothetical protein
MLLNDEDVDHRLSNSKYKRKIYFSRFFLERKVEATKKDHAFMHDLIGLEL